MNKTPQSGSPINSVIINPQRTDTFISGIVMCCVLHDINKYTVIPEILTGKMDVDWYLKRQNYIGFYKAIQKNEMLRFGCDYINEKDIDYVCMHAISEKKWHCFCDPSVSEAIKFLLHNKATVIVDASDYEIWREQNFYIQSAGPLSKYIDRHTKLNKKEFLDLVSKVKSEIES